MDLRGRVWRFNEPGFGDISRLGLCRPPLGVRVRATLTGNGYFELGNDGRIFPFGDAQGSARPILAFNNPPVDLAIRN
jgi:hypothetical protein